LFCLLPTMDAAVGAANPTVGWKTPPGGWNTPSVARAAAGCAIYWLTAVPGTPDTGDGTRTTAAREVRMIRVVVVDDEALVRSGFQLILNLAPDIEVVATADGRQALEAIAQHRPDVLLLDIRMPDMDGLSILAELRSAPHRPIVAVLTTFDSDEYVASALRLGAAGFLLKDTDPEQLCHFVRTLYGGGVVLSPTVSSTVVGGYLGGGADRSGQILLAALSDREREVLRLMADGLSNTEIGARMYLSVGTVKDHVSAVLGKLNVENRVQASLLAQRAGLLDTDRPTP